MLFTFVTALDITSRFLNNGYMSTKKMLAAGLVILVAIGGFVAGLILLRDRQDIGEQAAVPGGRATVTFNPSTGNYKVGDSIQTAVYFNTDNIAISGVAVKVLYPFSGTTPEVTVTSITVNPTLLSSGDWSCPTQETKVEGSNVVINISCTVGTAALGYTNNVDTLLANLSLRVQRVPPTSPLVLRFDPVESVVTRRSDNQDVLLVPVSSGSFNIEGAGAPSGTATPTVRATGSVTTTPTPTVKLTGTGTVTVTKTPTPTALPGAGISLPTYAGVLFGAVIIFAALLLAI
ncbi:MAG: hypothetical protein US62_C0011G0003 [Candidatus Woesebacteria bacterium GW2011_GWA1_37_8]|uniref:Uncharacterized protein n=2 Tax=Candidatus Woeseibacteriota TaxID=1752722 RepID=A0A0G0LEV0_9BACT|nr:MAG: hypothetical protein US62_C0011G0003 [Candidatus Woesebacteria bacterium GW2011_GWA1_37_8]KKQ86470.1 MAG: hypothetical protein UT10_C0024G0005 [Candidatus Woesebacteria bacterium GW2011_GWB1_38_8b]